MYSKQNTVAFVATPSELGNASLVATIKIVCKDNGITGKFFTVPEMSRNKVYLFCAFETEDIKNTFLGLLDSTELAYVDSDLTDADYTRLLS